MIFDLLTKLIELLSCALSKLVVMYDEKVQRKIARHKRFMGCAAKAIEQREDTHAKEMLKLSKKRNKIEIMIKDK